MKHCENMSLNSLRVAMPTLILRRRQRTYRSTYVVQDLRTYHSRPGDLSSTCASHSGISFSSASIHNMFRPISLMVTGLMMMLHPIPRLGTEPLLHFRLT